MGVKVREKDPGSGVYYVYISHRGQRKAKQIGDRKLAKKVAKQIEAKLVLGDLDIDKFNSKSPTFKKYAEMWFQLPHERADRTQGRYMSNVRNHVYPSLGSRDISKIRRKDIKTLFDTLSVSMRQNSLQMVRIPLNMIFKHALQSEVIETNPVTDITLSKTAKVKITPLDPQGQVDLLAEAQVYRGGIFYPHLLTLLRTGLRSGELCGLKWTDIDFENRFIKVSRTRTSGIVSPTKNRLTRQVDMSKQVTETLKDLKLTKQKQALKTGMPFSEWVFSQKDGRPLMENITTRALNKCLDRVGLPKMRVHDLRHTYATTRLLRGHDISDVSYQLGHSSISITYDIYTHWIPGKFKSQVDDLDMQLNDTQMQLETNL
jgi:integrase